MLSILGSILSGGATGLLGTAIQRYADHKNKKLDIQLKAQEQAHELAVFKARSEMAAAEWAGKMDVEDSKAFNTSLTSEPKVYSEGTARTPAQNWLMVILDFIRGIIRPGLTLYLCTITTVIYHEASSLLNAGFILPEMAYELVHNIVNTILYLTTTCVLWWFGTRNKAKQK